MRTNIVPGHPCVIFDGEGVADIIVYILEIHDTGVIIILAREEGPREIGGMNIGERMRMGVPTAKTKIQTANSGVLVVYHHNLRFTSMTRVIRKKWDFTFSWWDQNWTLSEEGEWVAISPFPSDNFTFRANVVGMTQTSDVWVKSLQLSLKEIQRPRDTSSSNVPLYALSSYSWFE